MPKYRIVRNIREVFEVVADDQDEAERMICDGEVETSEPLSDLLELVDEGEE